MLRFLAVAMLALTVAGCGSSALNDVVRTELVRPTLAPAAREPCAAPVSPPDRDLTQREIGDWWGRDRSALRECERRRAAAVNAIGGIQ